MKEPIYALRINAVFHVYMHGVDIVKAPTQLEARRAIEELKLYDNAKVPSGARIQWLRQRAEAAMKEKNGKQGT